MADAEKAAHPAALPVDGHSAGGGPVYTSSRPRSDPLLRELFCHPVDVHPLGPVGNYGYQEQEFRDGELVDVDTDIEAEEDDDDEGDRIAEEMFEDFESSYEE